MNELTTTIRSVQRVGMGQVASYNGCAAHPGYLLQQKLKHSCSRLHMLLCTASALLPTCYLQILHAAAPYLCKVRLCGAMLIRVCPTFCKISSLSLHSLMGSPS